MEDQAPYGKLLNAMKQQEIEDQLLTAKMVDAFDNLLLHNSVFAEQLIELTEDLAQYSIATVEDPAAELEIDRDRGMSINIGTAIRSLNNYAAPLRDGGEQEGALTSALFAIFREKERRVLNDL